MTFVKRTKKVLELEVGSRSVFTQSLTIVSANSVEFIVLKSASTFSPFRLLEELKISLQLFPRERIYLDVSNLTNISLLLLAKIKDIGATSHKKAPVITLLVNKLQAAKYFKYSMINAGSNLTVQCKDEFVSETRLNAPCGIKRTVRSIG